MCVCACARMHVPVFTGYHRRFKAFESKSFHHDGRIFGIHYGSGHLMGVMGRDTLKVWTVLDLPDWTVLIIFILY